MLYCAPVRSQAADPDPPRLPRVLESHTPTREGVLDEARWSSVRIEAVDLAGVVLRGVELDEVRLDGVDLSGAEALGLSILDCEIRSSSLANLAGRERCSMRRARIDRCTLTGLAWTGGTVVDVTFAECRLDLASFRFSALTRVTFADCLLRGVDLHGARLDAVRFHDCDLSGASFVNAELRGAELRRCRLDDLQGVGHLRGASLEAEAIVGLAGELAAALGIRRLD